MLRIASNGWSYRLRGIAYGSVVSMVVTISVGLFIAAARNEQPFHRGKMVSNQTMEAVGNVAVPIAAPIGGLIGVALGEWLWRRRQNKNGRKL